MALCPECDTDLDLDEDVLEEGEIITCRGMRLGFSRSSLQPSLGSIPWMSTTKTTTDEPAEEEDEDRDY